MLNIFKNNQKNHETLLEQIKLNERNVVIDVNTNVEKVLQMVGFTTYDLSATQLLQPYGKKT
ncbi:hypothetical protein [Peribacillus glennii]|uniref:hypothetical protein n=1 Tax=Peribacillus glennii TaxID=2303991 RepID=UPI001F485903|nr:hypothetical protein [Peribacillus glennii]